MVRAEGVKGSRMRRRGGRFSAYEFRRGRVVLFE